MVESFKDLGFKPLGARVLVEKYVEEKKDEFTTGSAGILIPSTKDENLTFKKNSGVILSMGTGLSEDAVSNLSVGMKITFKNPHIVNLKGEEYYLIHENNIEMIITDNK